MLLYDTIIKESKIPFAGLGCFINENVKSGNLVWENNGISEIVYSKNEFTNLPLAFKKSINKFIYKNNDKYFLNLDNSRFMNHSETPTLVMLENGSYISSKDLYIGDELTCNYKEFYDDDWLNYILNFKSN